MNTLNPEQIKPKGEYIHPLWKTAVTVYEAFVASGRASMDILFYERDGEKIVIDDRRFYGRWERVA